MNTQGTWVIVLIVVVFLSADCAAQPQDEEKILHQFFSVGSHSNEVLMSPSEQIPKICLELGDKAIPLLSEAIRHVIPSNAELAQIALDCLVRIGGSKVVELFRRMYNESQDESLRNAMRAALCGSMQSTGSPQDIQFLIESLKGPLYGPNAVAPSAAAYALAVLKPQSAKAPLEKRAKEYKDGFPSEVEFALDRINGMEWKTPQADSARGMDVLILTVFRFGIPHITVSDSFFERKTARIWKRDGSEWRFESPPPKVEDLPSISFDVFVTKDGRRAICSVGIVCGNVCGYGYDFVLKKDNAGWRVVGLFPTLIS